MKRIDFDYITTRAYSELECALTIVVLDEVIVPSVRAYYDRVFWVAYKYKDEYLYNRLFSFMEVNLLNSDLEKWVAQIKREAMFVARKAIVQGDKKCL